MKREEARRRGDSRPAAFGEPGATEAVTLVDDGVFPNNGTLALLVYRQAVDTSALDSASDVRRLFARNHWGGSWVNGIYGFHHYHSTAHEVLAVYGGEAKVQLGGEKGLITTVSAGDVVVVPAGVAHKDLGCSGDFTVVGAYPEGQRHDMCYGEAGERPGADGNIARVTLPKCDPLRGGDGPLMQYWSG